MESFGNGDLDTWSRALVPGQGHRKQKGFGWSFANPWAESPLAPRVQELLMHLWAQAFSLSKSSHQMQPMSARDQPCMGRTEHEGFLHKPK